MRRSTSTPWRRDSNETASGKPGAVHLHSFGPTTVLFAQDARHITAGCEVGQSESATSILLREKISKLEDCWSLARDKLNCIVLQQTFLPSMPTLLGNNEHRLPGSPNWFIKLLNMNIRDAADRNGIHLVDAEARAAQDGVRSWWVPVIWYRAKQEISPLAAPVYGDLVACVIASQLGKSFKCLVMDLDNTLWGGVVGDDGVEGIILGQGSALGEAFVRFQEYARELSKRGVILAVCSKNDETNARDPFLRHPEMVLRSADIACFVANWHDKAANIRQIATDLNIGLDAIVFLDDNPFERELVRRELPVVAVPEVTDDPALFAQCLADAGYFEGLNVTAEDLDRVAQYQLNRERAELKAQSSDLGSYLRTLEMKLLWRPFDRMGLDRIVQLINKTNQFNLTTRQYTEADVVNMMDDPSVLGLQLRLLDRYGDNGIIAIVIGKLNKRQEFVIDTWVMSCRVLGRQVEDATLSIIVTEAQELKAIRIVGEFRPTKKNSIVRALYDKLGFTRVNTDANGCSRNSLELSDFLPRIVPIQISQG